MGHALRSLCQRQARVLMLREVEGWRFEDIAALEGISMDALKSLMARARRTFKVAYQTMAIERGLHSIGGFVALVLGGFGRLRRNAERATGRIRAGDGGGSLTGLPVFSTAAMHLSQGLVALALLLSAGAPAPVGLAARDVSKVAQSHKAQPPSGGGGPERSRPALVPGAAYPQPSRPIGELVAALPDTNADVRQPEQTMITSIAVSPDFARDRTVFAIGSRTDCVASCTNVLFVSRDGGTEWTRLPAVGLFGEQLLLPPAYGRGDDRMFTAGPAGLQRSVDGGETFHFVGGPATQIAGGGTAAISPRFNTGDPVMIVGSQSPFEYHDPGVITPSSYSALVGPLDPAYAPEPRDDRILFGGLEVNPENTRSSVVYTCRGAMCTKARIAGSWLPKVRPAPDFADSDTVYAFTLYGLFVSADAGLTFHPLKASFKDAMLFDLVVTEHTLYLAVWKAGPNAVGGVYRSDDGGVTWTAGSGEVFERGARTLAVARNRLFAGRGQLGLACSADGGRTWASRC